MTKITKIRTLFLFPLNCCWSLLLLYTLVAEFYFCCSALAPCAIATGNQKKNFGYFFSIIVILLQFESVLSYYYCIFTVCGFYEKISLYYYCWYFAGLTGLIWGAWLWILCMIVASISCTIQCGRNELFGCSIQPSKALVIIFRISVSIVTNSPCNRNYLRGTTWHDDKISSRKFINMGETVYQFGMYDKCQHNGVCTWMTNVVYVSSLLKITHRVGSRISRPS